jgi:hypothetical protein
MREIIEEIIEVPSPGEFIAEHLRDEAKVRAMGLNPQDRDADGQDRIESLVSHIYELREEVLALCERNKRK